MQYPSNHHRVHENLSDDSTLSARDSTGLSDPRQKSPRVRRGERGKWKNSISRNIYRLKGLVILITFLHPDINRDVHRIVRARLKYDHLFRRQDKSKWDSWNVVRSELGFEPSLWSLEDLDQLITNLKHEYCEKYKDLHYDIDPYKDDELYPSDLEDEEKLMEKRNTTMPRYFGLVIKLLKNDQSIPKATFDSEPPKMSNICSNEKETNSEDENLISFTQEATTPDADQGIRQKNEPSLSSDIFTITNHLKAIDKRLSDVTSVLTRHTAIFEMIEGQVRRLADSQKALNDLLEQALINDKLVRKEVRSKERKEELEAQYTVETHEDVNLGKTKICY